MMECDRGPYEVILTGLAQANLSGLEMEAGLICNRILVFLQNNPHKLINAIPEANGDGSTFKFGINDCPGGAMVLTLNFREAEKKIVVLEIIHPALIVHVS